MGGIVVLCVVFCIILLLNEALKRSVYHQKNLFQIKKFREGVPFGLEVVNAGSSYGFFGLDWSVLSGKAFNFALVPQGLSYDFKILQQYQAHLREGCRVFIILPTLVFAFLDTQREIKQEKYYYFLQKESILQYAWLKELLWVHFPIFRVKYVLRWFYYVMHGSTRETVADLYEKETAGDLTTAEKEAQRRLEGWAKEFSLPDFSSAQSAAHLEERFRQTTHLLAEMIGFCLERKWEPILVVPPVSGALNTKVGRAFMSYVLYRNIERANRGRVKVLDYLYDARFQDYRLYCNADFLNKRGRRMFTETLLKESGEVGLVRGGKGEEG